MATLQHRRNKRNRANAIFNQPAQRDHRLKLRLQLVKSINHKSYAQLVVAFATLSKDTAKWANSVARMVRKMEECKYDDN